MAVDLPLDGAAVVGGGRAGLVLVASSSLLTARQVIRRSPPW